MSITQTLLSEKRAVGALGGTLAKGTGLVHAISTSLNPPGGSFWDQLKPASYRGIPFGVTGGQVRFGRRNALHEYPFRDTPWVEDLGRMSRRIQISGFLVGDDVIAQRERLIAACEAPGDGELVHPTLGRLKVSVMEVSAAETWERGRVAEISFTFVEQGQRLFPGEAVASGKAIAIKADTAQAAAAARFGTILGSLATVGSIASQIAGTASAWITTAVGVSNSATSLMNVATSLRGDFGRLLGQNSGISFDNVRSQVTSLPVLIGAGAAARTSVASAVADLQAAATVVDGSSFDAFAKACSSLAAAVKAASFTPADALASMQALTVLPSTATPAQAATVDLLRRSAVCELARASGDYQPSTGEEASAVRTAALAAIDAEILVAGNQGDDGVYTSLRALRAEVIRDMNAKGAQLPTLVTVETITSMPSLPLAQRLYTDPGRDDELVRRANPVHPAFMPTKFLALSA